MKTEKEIRAHRDALEKAMALPCDCIGEGHSMQCLIGLKMMTATSQTLSWALGENDEMDRLVEDLGADVKRRTM